MKQLLGLCAILVLAVSVAWAGEDLGTRKISNLGCHNGDGTCYVTLEGATFGSSLGCPNAPVPEFRFDNADTDAGKRSYATFLSAFLYGKPVVVHVDGCTQQGYPKLQYFRVVN